MIRLEGISKYYNSDANVVLGLRRVNLELNLGEFVAITGESGSGKSTHLNVISGLDKYDEGELFVNGEETSYFSVEEQEQYRKQYVGFVFQNYNIIDSFTVLENVMAALMIQGYDPKTRKARALELIDKVGLTSHKNHRASKLSGGQKQRAVIARALAKDCPIIVADEPTGNLDSKTGEMVMALLKEVSKDKLVIVVTHNYDQAAPYVTRKIRMYDGEIVEDKVFNKTEPVKPTEPKAPVNLAVLDVFIMALMSIFRMPKKSILVFITLLFAMVGVNSLYALNNYVPFLATGGNSWNDLFPNNFEGRVIVTKKDDTAFTQLELDELLDRSDVIDLIHNDFLLDENFYVTDNADPYNGIEGRPYLSTYVKSNELSSGRLPQNKNEIVVRNLGWKTTTYAINDIVNIHYGFEYYEIYESDITARYEQFEMTVVGILDGDYGLYDYVVHPDFFNQNVTNTINPNNFLAARYINVEFSLAHEDIYYYADYRSVGIDDSLPDNQISIHPNLLDYFATRMGVEASVVLSSSFVWTKFPGKFEGEKQTTVTIANTSANEKFPYWMNSKTYMSLTSEGPYQITLLVKDAFDADKVMRGLSDEYHTIHPASYEGESWGIGGLSFLTVMAFGLLGGFLYIIINLVIKSVIQSRKKDFVIFRSIGASKKDLKRMLVIEQVIYSFVSYILAIIALFIMNTLIEDFKVMRFIEIGFYFVSYALFLGALLLITRKFSIRLFGRSVITTLKSE
ncbi:MAG: hypothetical protein CVV63_00485 [Tenericutes bacterium HGW-Tenericutes-8]|nr:MAG: hypothetical protein CVV63_00485 [Tenericutes bacterium HGW-Tenericutes-8]